MLMRLTSCDVVISPLIAMPVRTVIEFAGLTLNIDNFVILRIITNTKRSFEPVIKNIRSYIVS